MRNEKSFVVKLVGVLVKHPNDKYPTVLSIKRTEHQSIRLLCIHLVRTDVGITKNFNSEGKQISYIKVGKITDQNKQMNNHFMALSALIQDNMGEPMLSQRRDLPE